MKKSIARSVALALTCALTLSACGGSSGSTASTASSADGAGSTASTGDYKWPTQPVNVVCPASAGGGTDNILRVMNEYFVERTGQSFVINNITGISGYEMTHQANTDGYDFICGTTTIFTSKLDGTLDYDYEDYEMVAFQSTPYDMTCIAVQASSPYQTLNDLMDAAKADPASITGGITMSGQPYMCAMAMQDALGFELYTVDVGNTGERNAALLGGQVDWILTNTSTANPYVESGDFRILAVCGQERYPMNPDVPTFTECGYGFEFPAQPMVWLAPKGTPAEACEAFNAILADISTDPDFINDIETKLNAVVNDTYSIKESKELAKEYKDTLAPYVK